jgi:hypothetical protein
MDVLLLCPRILKRKDRYGINPNCRESRPDFVSSQILFREREESHFCGKLKSFPQYKKTYANRRRRTKLNK